ncbi:MAG: DNA mismatch repair protein MutS, partial [Clostridia bacterium]|nr:DNA mismatch repair protein MutS [Clostridia bacterium]
LSDLLDALVRISPVEIISNNEAQETFNNSPLVVHGVLPRFQAFTESEFNLNNAINTLKSQLNVLTLDAFGFSDCDECVCSSGALVSYLHETQKHALININKIKRENTEKLMMLDINAIRNLELTKTLRDGKRYGSLLWLLDKTKTSMGARKLQNLILSPLNDIDKINYRLDGVESLYKNTLIRQSLQNSLSAVKDIGRITGKISNGNLTAKDCVSLRTSLELLPNIKFQLIGIDAQFICDIVDNLNDFSNTVNLLKNAIVDEPPNNMKDGGYIKNGYNTELDNLRSMGTNSKSMIAEIENRERENTGIRTLKIGYNRVFGYYIEVTNSFKDKVPYNYLRRQTLANAERYVTEELKELEVKILSSDEKALQLENKIFTTIKEHLISLMSELQATANAIADLDVLLSLANVARENNYVRPEVIVENGKLDIVDGRHPVVESISKQRFIPNDCLLDNDENRTMILTGPNMAGKSTYMRQVALITLMAHIGCFVPAKSAQIPLTDKIFTRIGASDNLISDQSTFMVEMSEMATILNNATSSSLLILDEIGRGTSTFDGLSIAWAVVEYITNMVKAKTMFATHYHELTELEGRINGIKNYKVTVKELQGSIVFLRKIMRGGANKSFGIEVAELAGVDKLVTERAKKILKTLEKSDITKKKDDDVVTADNPTPLSEVERILIDVDVNNLTPMQAFNILIDLNEKIKGKN